MHKMTQNTEQDDTKPVYDFQELNQAVRRWAVMTQFEQDQENYEKLKQQYE